MATINTSNVDTLVYQFPSIEKLNRLNISQQKKTIDNFIKAQKEHVLAFSSLTKKLSNGSITRDEFEKSKNQFK